MSVLSRETRSCLSQFIVGCDDGLSARFAFPAEFSGFKGHFPGDPVLPAVCMVQAVVVMVEAWRRAPVKVRSIMSAKWFSPVRPGTELRFESRVRQDGDQGSVVKTRITSGVDKIAELTLRVSCPVLGEEDHQ